jgi:hypothetical protein
LRSYAGATTFYSILSLAAKHSDINFSHDLRASYTEGGIDVIASPSCTG